MTNYHTYTYVPTKKQKLPPGRWLVGGDLVNPETDLYCPSNGPSVKLQDMDVYDVYAPINDTYYRPNTVTSPKPKKQYRILKGNEKVKVGDQAYDNTTRGWFTVISNSIFPNRLANSLADILPGFRFRRPVKSP